MEKSNNSVHVLLFIFVVFALVSINVIQDKELKQLRVQTDSLKMNQKKSDSILLQLSDPFSESKYDSIMKSKGYENQY